MIKVRKTDWDRDLSSRLAVLWYSPQASSVRASGKVLEMGIFVLPAHPTPEESQVQGKGPAIWVWQPPEGFCALQSLRTMAQSLGHSAPTAPLVTVPFVPFSARPRGSEGGVPAPGSGEHRVLSLLGSQKSCMGAGTALPPRAPWPGRRPRDTEEPRGWQDPTR